jgi:hypothetical protein
VGFKDPDSLSVVKKVPFVLPCMLPKKLVPRLALTAQFMYIYPCAKKVLGAVTNTPTAASSSAMSGSLLLHPVLRGSLRRKK